MDAVEDVTLVLDVVLVVDVVADVVLVDVAADVMALVVIVNVAWVVMLMMVLHTMLIRIKVNLKIRINDCKSQWRILRGKVVWEKRLRKEVVAEEVGV